jgi:hypothetical protein
VRLAVVRSLGGRRRLEGRQDEEDFEQELVDQFLLASVAAGFSDAKVSEDRSAVFEFLRFLGRPVWTCQPADADRFLAEQRQLGRARTTAVGKTSALAQFFEFVVARYQGDNHALTGFVVCQPIDEFNRPAQAEYASSARVPPSVAEVEALFVQWRVALPQARSICRQRRTMWRRRCGGGWGCGSPNR